MKKINTLAKNYLRTRSPERERLLSLYGNLPFENDVFKKPENLILDYGTKVSSFGIEVLEADPGIYVRLPLRDLKNDFIELNFKSACSNAGILWKGTPVNENYEPTGKSFSLRTTEEQISGATFKITGDTSAIKLTPNFNQCLVNLRELAIFPADIEVNVSNDIPKNLPKHKLYVCFPIIDWEFRKQRPQHLMRKLAEEGNHIIYLSTRFYGFHEEYAISHDLEPRITKLTLPGNFRLNLYKDTPTVRTVEQACRALTTYLLDRAFEDVVLVCHLPFWLPFVKKLKAERGYPIVYDCMDDHAGFENNTKEMLQLEEDLCEQADLLVTSSQLLYEEKSKLNRNCALIRNAGEVEHFSQFNGEKPKSIEHQPKPIIGYFGAISDWFDHDAIIHSAKRHPEWTLFLIGHFETSTWEKFSEFKNIVLVGEIDYNLLPGYLASFDVCLIPFRRIPLTEATNPVKIYEYFASGKPVISRRLPEVEAFADVTYLYETNDEFVGQIEVALKEKKDDEKVELRKEYAKNNRWTNRAESFENLVDKFEDKVSIIIISYEALPFLRKCITSILKNTEYQNYEIVIVDNNSSEPVTSYLTHLERECPKVKVILNDHNAGFAAANNQGIKATTDSEYYVLLNNDTVVPSGWLHRLLYYARKPEIGIVGPVTNCIGNEAQIHTAYQCMDEMNRISWGLKKHFQGEIFDIKVLAMFCVAFRREIIDKVGYLDENFSIGMFEDDDYAQRTRAAGLRVVCAEDIFVHHYGSVSFKQLDQKNYKELFDKNRKVYEEKWGIWTPHTYR